MRPFVSPLFRVVCPVLCLVLVLPTAAVAMTPVAMPAMEAGMAQQRLEHRGVGKMVKLVRTDRTEVRGRIAAVRTDGVDLEVSRQASPVTVAYSSLAEVRKPGLSRGAKIGIGVGVGVLVAAGIFAIVVKHEIDKPWNFNVPGGLL